MIKKAIRNLHSSKNNSPRVFDVIVDGDKILLEIKMKDSMEIIPWEDVVYQVKIATGLAK